MKILLRCILLLFMFATFLTVSGQTNANLIRSAGNIMQFDNIWPQEKVYLQFDNTGYFQGETIWFKAYVVNASDLQQARSGVLYVDLISPNGVILQQKKLKVIRGQADGSFSLMDASTEQARQIRGMIPYPSGYYEIRAYTQHMMNFDDRIAFSRVLPVFKSPSKEGDYDNAVFLPDYPNSLVDERPKAEKMEKVNVSFYPEGGHIVEGIPVNVAFKATDALGYNIDGTLRIENNISEGSVEALTEHDGMGSIRFTPTSTKKINAIFTHNGKDYRFALPATDQHGYSIIVTEQYDDDLIKLEINRNVETMYRAFGLTITCRGKLFHYDRLTIPVNATSYTNLISTEGWPMGVCHLVLYDIEGNVLASRHLFHYNKFTPPSINIEKLDTDFSPFSKVNLSLQIKDKDGTPFRDRIALSVRDSKEYGTIYSDNLITNLLLSSDLRGYINKPEYYLESDDEQHRRHTDLLMLVQGWERYDWKSMSGKDYFEEKRRMEDSLSLNGWVLDNRVIALKENVMKNIDVFVSIIPPDKTKGIEYGSYKTEKIGYFGFDTKDYYGTADLLMLMVNNADNSYDFQTRMFMNSDNTSSRKVKMLLERALMPKIRSIDVYEKTFNNKDRNSISIQKSNPEASISPMYKDFGILLPTVEIRDRKYIDYMTFQAYDVEKDVEAVLDLGEYPTDVLGYLLKKGYTVYEGALYEGAGNFKVDYNPEYVQIARIGSTSVSEIEPSPKAYINRTRINGKPVFWYVHNDEKCLYTGMWDSIIYVDTRDIESIVVYDEPLYLTDIRSEVPLYMKYINSRMNLQAQTDMTTATEKYYLVNVQAKEEHELMDRQAKRDFGRRITTLKGFTAPDQFYAPEYPDGPIPGDVDYRRTLYWNPNLVTDSVGRAQVEFYNNSYSTGFSISGTGMTASGTPYIIDETYTKPED